MTRRRSILAVLMFVSLSPCALSQTPVPQDPPSLSAAEPTHPAALRTLTTVREAHGLSADEALRAYPIHLRAVVTYFDPSIDFRRIGMFIHDATGSIYVGVPRDVDWGQAQPPAAGTLIEIWGVSAAGDFAPIIHQPRVRILAPSHLPVHATPVTLSHLLTGTDDCRWVEIVGVVRSVIESATHITLQVAMADGTIGATTTRQPGIDYTPLVDATVRIHGNAGALFNSNRQMTGSRLYFPGFQTVTVLEPGRPDIFAQPPRPLSSLSRFTPTLAWSHRVHVRGTVTLHWPGRKICIEDGTQGMCAQSSQTTPLAVGSSADLAGFTALAGFRPSLDNAAIQASSETQTFTIPVITSEQALKGDNDSEPVTIRGRLIGRDVDAHDSTLVIASGKSVFRAILPNALSNSFLSEIHIGSRLSITGICSVQFDSMEALQNYGEPQSSGFRMLLRSPRDVIVLQTPSWWTSTRIGLALLFTMAITVAVAVWVFVLRRRVEQKTRELRESRELYRHMAHHDTLTGLPTRALLHDHLQTALERSRRFRTGVALLMLDLDNFKKINDSYGHDFGDHVLQITANRLSSMIRKTDCIARMGGDEFIVLLNDLVDLGQAELVAEKVVAALSLAVKFGKLQVPVSASVGVCTISDGSVDAEVVLKRVDAAMYRAKQRGRSCFQTFTHDMIATSESEFAVAPYFPAALDPKLPTSISGRTS